MQFSLELKSADDGDLNRNRKMNNDKIEITAKIITRVYFLDSRFIINHINELVFILIEPASDCV